VQRVTVVKFRVDNIYKSSSATTCLRIKVRTDTRIAGLIESDEI